MEEAKVLYVAITRAKKSLSLTYSTTKAIPTKRGIWEKNQTVSRFINFL